MTRLIKARKVPREIYYSDDVGIHSLESLEGIVTVLLATNESSAYIRNRKKVRKTEEGAVGRGEKIYLRKHKCGVTRACT